MNHLLAVELVREILNGKGDDFLIKSWMNKVRRSDTPEEVITSLKKAVKASSNFDTWSETLGDVSHLSWTRNFSSLHLLFWGHIPGKLEKEKEYFLERYEEEKDKQQKMFNNYVKQQDALRLA